MPNTEIKKQKAKHYWVVRIEPLNWEVQGDQVLIGVTSSVDLK